MRCGPCLHQGASFGGPHQTTTLFFKWKRGEWSKHERQQPKPRTRWQLLLCCRNRRPTPSPSTVGATRAAAHRRRGLGNADDDDDLVGDSRRSKKEPEAKDPVRWHFLRLPEQFSVNHDSVRDRVQNGSMNWDPTGVVLSEKFQVRVQRRAGVVVEGVSLRFILR